MQRKNNFLKNVTFKRNSKPANRTAIAMIMAIMVLVVIATIMALSLAMTAQTTKRTSDLYLYEQSVLLSKSATEYALLLISQNPICSDLNRTFTQDGIYEITLEMSYILDSNTLCNTNGGTLFTTVQTQEQIGSAIIDVTVRVLNTQDGDTNAVTNEPIRFFRRSIQKL